MQYQVNKNEEKRHKLKKSTRAIMGALALPLAGVGFITPSFAQNDTLEAVSYTHLTLPTKA